MQLSFLTTISKAAKRWGVSFNIQAADHAEAVATNDALKDSDALAKELLEYLKDRGCFGVSRSCQTPKEQPNPGKDHLSEARSKRGDL